MVILMESKNLQYYLQMGWTAPAATQEELI
jgi:hypothetical protein